jgi:hypothetical protein
MCAEGSLALHRHFFSSLSVDHSFFFFHTISHTGARTVGVRPRRDHLSAHTHEHTHLCLEKRFPDRGRWQCVSITARRARLANNLLEVLQG